MSSIYEKLSNPFPPDKISWRVGQVTKNDKYKASALCYIDSRDVMRRLDEAVTPACWQDTYNETAKGRLICTISIKIGDEWVSKSDGAGDTAVESEKGAISDSFKRAAVKWGVGRYLYDVPMQWVKINDFKQIEKSEFPKLQRALPGSRIADAERDEPPPPNASWHGSGTPSNTGGPAANGATAGNQTGRDESFYAMPSYAIAPYGTPPNWQEWSQTMMNAMRWTKDDSELVKLDMDNGPHLQQCQIKAPAIHKIVRAAFAKRGNQLLEKAA